MVCPLPVLRCWEASQRTVQNCIEKCFINDNGVMHNLLLHTEQYHGANNDFS